jgi:hypothetical protein
MKQILKFGNSQISLVREESDGCCQKCFFNDRSEGCTRYAKYKTTDFWCDETHDSGDVDEDGEEITYTDYFIWRRDNVLDECTVVI